MVLLEKIPALGTFWWFELFDAAPKKRAELEQIITKRLEEFDTTYSRFKTDSLIGTLNRTGKLTDPPTELLTLLALGVDLYKKTEGVFNFVSAHQQVAQGYGHTETVRETSTGSVSPEEALTITRDSVTLSAGAVDLGGFGKGWLIDDLAKLLVDHGVNHFLINGGGDMFASTLPDGSPIEIYLEHPNAPSSFVAKVPLRNQGLAASSTYKRQWEQDGKVRHHILSSHDNERAAHVIADSALTADVYATLACALDEQQAQVILGQEAFSYLLMQGNDATFSENFAMWLLQKGD